MERTKQTKTRNIEFLKKAIVLKSQGWIGKPRNATTTKWNDKAQWQKSWAATQGGTSFGNMKGMTNTDCRDSIIVLQKCEEVAHFLKPSISNAESNLEKENASWAEATEGGNVLGGSWPTNSHALCWAHLVSCVLFSNSVSPSYSIYCVTQATNKGTMRIPKERNKLQPIIR